jgi:hypothetical protein
MINYGYIKYRKFSLYIKDLKYYLCELWALDYLGCLHLTCFDLNIYCFF